MSPAEEIAPQGTDSFESNEPELTAMGGWRPERFSLIPGELQASILGLSHQRGTFEGLVFRDPYRLAPEAEDIVAQINAGTLLNPEAEIPSTVSAHAHKVTVMLRSGELTDKLVDIPKDLTRDHSSLIDQIRKDFEKHCKLDGPLCTWVIRSYLSATISSEQIDAALLERVREEIRPVLFDEEGVNRTDFKLHLALEECFINHIRHGHGCNPMPMIVITHGVDAQGNYVITSADEGPGFDPASVADPTEDDNLELSHGRGIMLMRSFVDDVSYSDDGRKVTMVVKLADLVRRALDEKGPFTVEEETQ